jgi:hypothetical protein
VTASRPPQAGQEIMPASDTRIGRIVAAVDGKFVPVDIDYSALEKSIELHVHNYRARVEGELSRKRYEPHIKRRRRVIKMAQKLLVAVQEIDDDDWDGFAGWVEKETNEDVICHIERLVRGCENAVEALEEVGSSKWGDGSWIEPFSHIHLLIGFDLPMTFEDHFKWSSTTEDGPCVGFIQQVLVEYDINPYQPGAISRMIRDARSLRIRRK